MDPTQNDLFALAERRLAWTNERQMVLAQNIANSAVPGYRSRDVPPFGKALQIAAPLVLFRTGSGHLAEARGVTQRPILDKQATVSLAGNAVSLDAQLSKVSETRVTQQMVSAIYKKFLNLFALALGNNVSSQ